MEDLNITVLKNELLVNLEKNKQRFVKSYNRLLKAYEKKAIKYQEEYQKFVQKVKDKKLSKNEFQPQPPPRPEDRTKNYDLYIKMIGLHNAHTIELSERMFQRLWEDQWDWMRTHINNLSFFAADSGEVEEALSWYAVGD